MKPLHVICAALTMIAGMTGIALAVTIDTVSVGDAGNSDDSHGDGYGGVSYTYKMGKYEVTAGQYCEFLNAVAKTDTNNLYNTKMNTEITGCKITRTGSSGSYSYDFSGRPSGTAESDWKDRPVNYVSYWDSCRFANWLHNDQPTGDQGSTTTERGAYTLDGYTGSDGSEIVRNSKAKWAVPTEDEWYKAAYYKGGSKTAGYWDYPTRSDTAPSNDLVSPDAGNNATFYKIESGQSSYTIDDFYRTNIGDHEKSGSYYGTFDQGGNVSEWNESIVSEDTLAAYRSMRGGNFTHNVGALKADSFSNSGPNIEYDYVGFRVAEVPEPATMLLLTLGGLAVIKRKRS